MHVRDLDLRFPDIDLLTDGFILVGRREDVGRTVSDYEDGGEPACSPNARILDASGTATHAFHVGDGIAQVLADTSDNIWISYFDEASICAPIQGNAVLFESDTDLSYAQLLAPVLIRWTRDGSPAWYIVWDEITNHGLDCYALNVDESRTWAYIFPGFGLVEIDERGTRCVRRTAVRGAYGIAVSGSRIGLLGSYGDRQSAGPAMTLYCGDLRDGTLDSVEAIGLQMPDGSWCRHRKSRINCRGSRIWLEFDDSSEWFLLEL